VCVGKVPSSSRNSPLRCRGTYLPTLRSDYLLSQIPIEDQRDPQDGTCRTRLLQGYLKSLSDIRRDLYDHSMNLTATPN
jgi:hypothetical protein